MIFYVTIFVLGGIFATALLFIGQCWGKQMHSRQYHINTTPEAIRAATSLREEHK